MICRDSPTSEIPAQSHHYPAVLPAGNKDTELRDEEGDHDSVNWELGMGHTTA